LAEIAGFFNQSSVPAAQGGRGQNPFGYSGSLVYEFERKNCLWVNPHRLVKRVFAWLLLPKG
jgi:hypothetical protein